LIYNKRQAEGVKSLSDKSKVLHHHFGGSRSGKTVLDVRAVILRAMGWPGTRHLIARASKSSCVTSVWMQTLLDILSRDFPGCWVEDQTKRIINFANGSSIWAGGFDNRRHTDEILSKEWATILVVEATELGYLDFKKLLTRLNWNPAESKIPLKFITECNPTVTSHWTNQYFIKGIDIEGGEELTEKERDQIAWLHFSPEDNAENLSPVYLEKLRTSRGMMRKRFYEGIYADSFEGQVYDTFSRGVNVVNNPVVYNPAAEVWRFWDFGIDPSDTAICWVQIVPVPKSKEFDRGFKIEVFDEYINKNKDVHHYSNIVNSKNYNNSDIRDAGDPAGATRNESLESWISKLRGENIQVEVPRRNPSIADYISNANELIPYVRICEAQCPRFTEMFENWSYPKDRDGQVVQNSKPQHDTHSHPGTAWYYGIWVKWPGKKSEVILPKG